MANRCLLYYITDRSQFRGDEDGRRRQLLAKIGEAARAGVDYIQLREKHLPAREMESLAFKAMQIVRERRTANGEQQTALLINSRTDVALAAGADGVHLRSDDISPAEVRRVWAASATSAAREKPLVAVSCHTKFDVDEAQSQAAHFAVFAPVFEKNNSPEVHGAGLAALREACRAKIPVLALGGITLQNAAACLDAGAAGVAGIRLFQEHGIEDVVRTLRALQA